MGILSTLKNAKQWDARRASVPGEHWLVLGFGLLVLARARRSRSFVARTAGQAVAGAMLARAASGRDGALAKIRRQGRS